jgi:hypothetical protein
VLGFDVSTKMFWAEEGTIAARYLTQIAASLLLLNNTDWHGEFSNIGES